MKTCTFAIPAQFRVQLPHADAVMLREDDRYTVVQGELAGAVYACLQEGPIRYTDLVDRLQPLFTEQEVYDTLTRLGENGLVQHYPDDIPALVRSLSGQLGVPPGEVLCMLENNRVEVEAYGVDPAPFMRALSAVGLRSGTPATFRIVLARDYLDLDPNRYAPSPKGPQAPLLLIQPAGTVFLIGPVFVPGKTACPTCLTHWLYWRQPAARFLQSQVEAVPVFRSVALPESLLAVTAGMAAWQVVEWLVANKRHLEGQIMRVDLRTGLTSFHPVRRLAHCPHCGNNSALPGGSPVSFGSRKKQPGTDGGYRVLTLEDAAARLAHLVDPVLGLLGTPAFLSEPQGAPFYTVNARHALIGPIDSLEVLALNEQYGYASGKGKSLEQSLASMRYEAAERLSAVYRGDERLITGSYEDLQPYAIHVARLLGYSARQYTSRHEWNATHPHPALFVTEPFDETKRLEWMAAYTMEGRLAYVPASYVLFGYPTGPAPCCLADSNGNAAGAVVEEAFLSGMLEVVERDATSIYFYHRLRRPAVDLASFGDPYLIEVQRYYRETLGRDLWVLDVTSDVGIPCFVAVSRRLGGSPEAFVLGHGCHLSAHVALTRAVTECNQILHGLLQQPHDHAFLGIEPTRKEWLTRVTLAGHPYLGPDPKQHVRTATDYAYTPTDDLLDDIHNCLARIRARGLEVYVVDLTRDDLGVPSLKVIIPGMIHWVRRLGHPRLVDVPLEMGWLQQKPSEDDLNPLSIFW